MSDFGFKLDLSEPPPDREPPAGGWVTPTCTFESHKWTLEIEEGRASIHCCDPCDPSTFHPAAGDATCEYPWEPEDLTTPDPIPVLPTYVDDSTPCTPAGPAEYGFYIEVRGA